MVILPLPRSMRNSLTKLGEGAFAEVFGCLGDDRRKKMALKVREFLLISIALGVPL